MNSNFKCDIIKYIKDEVIKLYRPEKNTEKLQDKLKRIDDILWKKDYEELYRLANMIDRFGLDIVMEVVHE
jgi:hypothetical protein